MRANRSMPSCSLIPVLAYDDVAEAVRWLTSVLGFRTRWIAGEHRAQLAFGDCAVAVTAAGAADRPDADVPGAGPVTHAVMVRVEDVDAHFANAREHGARILSSPADYPYGERQYELKDPGGHRWAISQTLADVAPEDWGGTTTPGDGR